MNHVEIWLKLLHEACTDRLKLCTNHYAAKPQTPSCPTVLLFGQAQSDHLYCDPLIRPALDAWDVGRVTAYDIVRWGKREEASRDGAS